MKYTVKLVQRGISSNTHPVSGKSGKLYGQASYTAADRGVVFKMSLADYDQAAHDIAGNTAGSQQWVPEFIPELDAPLTKSRCGIPSGCPNDATHIWDKFLFCALHAPLNAVPLDGVAPTIVEATAPALILIPPAPDTPPVMQEKGDIELPTEHMPPPAVASEEVNEEAHRSPACLPRPVPKPATTATPVVVTPVKAPDGAPKAVDVIADAVMERILPVLTKRIEELLPRPTKKTLRRPSEFRRLQAQASELGINSFQKSAPVLRRLIAEKQAA
jgi:hypothetical protein